MYPLCSVIMMTGDIEGMNINYIYVVSQLSWLDSKSLINYREVVEQYDVLSHQ